MLKISNKMMLISLRSLIHEFFRSSSLLQEASIYLLLPFITDGDCSAIHIIEVLSTPSQWAVSAIKSLPKHSKEIASIDFAILQGHYQVQKLHK